MISRLRMFVKTRLLAIIGVVMLMLVVALGTTVHLWRGAVADAATWHQTSKQLRQTVEDSEAENTRLRERIQRTQKVLADNAQAQQAINKRASELLAALTNAQDAASAAYQHCRAMALPDSVARLLRSNPTDHPDAH